MATLFNKQIVASEKCPCCTVGDNHVPSECSTCQYTGFRWPLLSHKHKECNGTGWIGPYLSAGEAQEYDRTGEYPPYINTQFRQCSACIKGRQQNVYLDTVLMAGNEGGSGNEQREKFIHEFCIYLEHMKVDVKPNEILEAACMALLTSIKTEELEGNKVNVNDE